MSESPDILELAIPTHLRRNLDYLPPLDAKNVKTWPPGIRIQTTLGKKTVVGILISVKSNTAVPANKIKTATAKLDETPILTPSLLALCQWASEYYHYPLGEVISQCLPKALREGRQNLISTPTEKFSGPSLKPDMEILLNDSQRQAVNAITAAKGFQTFLLDGITGSGKTEVYFQSMAKLLEQGKQALVLVPEITLTPQMVERFTERFNIPIALLHSGLTAKKRLNYWQAACTGQAGIIIGTRSAIFTPLRNPGIIILDEEHDLSFKQQTLLRYSARDMAIVRGQLENIPVVLGSATPSLESFYNAKIKKYTYLSLPKRAGSAEPPKVSVINIRNKRLVGGLSAPLLEKMREHLNEEKQVLLFLNRRGYASVLICHQCGWMAKCNRCDSPFTLHFNPERLRCHHCGSNQNIPTGCQNCQHSELITVGQGTQRIEEVIQAEFPDRKMVRIDRDTTQKRGSMEKLLQQIHNREVQILIGTQMLAKGHHFPNLSLVAIIEADGGLFSVDFRALERMGQLLVQVSGRAGRTGNSGEVIIQTHFPDHPQLQLLLREGYGFFSKALLKERQQTTLPPFAHLALLRADSNKREVTQQFLTEAKSLSEAFIEQDSVTIWGPIPAPMERCAGRFRGHLLLQSIKRHVLQKFLQQWVAGLSQCRSVNKVRWSLDIDPQEMV